MNYKKIYIEITNICNLSCSFCIQNTRQKQYMTKDSFQEILKKIQPYTKYLYFHVLGEPCIHPNINEFIQIAKHSFFINITTNGYLIHKLEDKAPIRQLNISLHSYHPKYKKTLEEYMQNIFQKINTLSNTYISFRFWVDSPYNQSILSILNKQYHKNISLEQLKNLSSIQLQNKVFLNPANSFLWPDLENSYYEENGNCYGTIDHIAILVDGTIIPCCLDTKANINLGNIFTSTLKEIQNSEKYQIIQKGFLKNKRVEELCKHCNFMQSRKEKEKKHKQSIPQ